MRMLSLAAALALAVLLASAVAVRPALAQDATTVAKDAATVAKEKARVVFTEMERRTIEEFYKKLPGQAGTPETAPAEADDDAKGGKDKAKKDKGKKDKKEKKGKEGLPSGLAKKDELPPGLQKHLEKNGTLPPGLAKRALPADLQAKLPAPAPGLERVEVGQDVVLVESATGKVLDVLRDVVKGAGAPGK